MVTHASFSPGAGSLFVIGDSLDNSIVVSRDPAGTILINNGAVSVDGICSNGIAKFRRVR